MQVSTNGLNNITIILSNAEVDDFKAMASSQGWSLRVFVTKAINGYYRLLRDVKGP